jgi:hypothetical protein
MLFLIPPFLDVELSGNYLDKEVVKLRIKDVATEQAKRGVGVLTSHPLLSNLSNDCAMKLIKEICYKHCVCENVLPIPRLSKFVK